MPTYSFVFDQSRDNETHRAGTGVIAMADLVAIATINNLSTEILFY